MARSDASERDGSVVGSHRRLESLNISNRDSVDAKDGSDLHLLKSFPDSPQVGKKWASGDGMDGVVEDEEADLEAAERVVELINKPGSWKRWIVLVLATMVIWGAYYSFDNPGATQQMLRDRFGVPRVLGPNSTKAENASVAEFNVHYNLLYSLYSLPNTVLPLFGGVLVDRIGFRRMTVYTSALAMLGQLGLVLGAYYRMWPVMWVARAVFGIGTESMAVAQRILVAEWFMGRELAFAMGMVLSFGRLASTVNDNISALFDECYDAYWVGFALCVVSLGCAMLVTHMDAEHERGAKRAAAVEDWAAFERMRGRQPPVQLRDVFKLPLRFWLFCGMAFVLFPPVTSFNNISAQEIETRWAAMGKTGSIAMINETMGWMYVVSAVLALGAGWAVDRAGRRAIFVVCASALLALCHLALALTDIVVIIPILCLGLGFAFVAAAFWPAIAYVIPATSFGLAYGVVGVFQNAGLATGPAVVSILQPPACDGTYFCVEMLFVSFAIAGSALAFWSHILEIRAEKSQKTDSTTTSSSTPSDKDNPSLEDPLLDLPDIFDDDATENIRGRSQVFLPNESIMDYSRRVRQSKASSGRNRSSGGRNRSSGGRTGSSNEKSAAPSVVEALREHASRHDLIDAEPVEEDDEDDYDDEGQGMDASVWGYVGSMALGGQAVARDRLLRASRSSTHDNSSAYSRTHHPRKS